MAKATKPIPPPAPDAPLPERPPAQVSVVPLAYRIARKEIGVKETAGSEDNPRVLEYHRSTRLPESAVQDETAWCSSFVNWCMKQAGQARTMSASALSWLRWGVALDEPVLGCVVVFSRHVAGAPDGVHGHVGFYVGTKGDDIIVLGGNQHNEVCEKPYPKKRLLAYRGAA
jgi:uncharacterized protein (TIGR02594 family)